MSTFLSKVPRHIVNQNKVGDIYILVFKGAEAIRKIAHRAILIDVAGTTNESHFHGVLLHLTANAIDRKTEFRIDDRSWKRSIFYESVGVGKTIPPNNINMFQLRKWAMALQEFDHDICDELVEHQGNTIWSSKLNCQVFVRVVLQLLGFKWPGSRCRTSEVKSANKALLHSSFFIHSFKWPGELSFIDDGVIPMVVDFSIGFISCKANKFNKKGNLDDDTGNDDDSS